MTYVFPALGKIYDKVSPYSYSFMRFCTGAVLAPHGVQKLFLGGMAGNIKAVERLGMYPPTFWALLVGFTECVCASLLALGLFTRVAALFIIGEMAFIAFHVQIKYGYFWTQRGNEFPLLLFFLALAIFFRGGGRYSLDALIGKEI